MEVKHLVILSVLHKAGQWRANRLWLKTAKASHQTAKKRQTVSQL